MLRGWFVAQGRGEPRWSARVGSQGGVPRWSATSRVQEWQQLLQVVFIPTLLCTCKMFRNLNKYFIFVPEGDFFFSLPSAIKALVDVSAGNMQAEGRVRETQDYREKE